MTLRRRKRLVPVWLLPSVVATILVIIGGGLLARANYLASLVTVPDVIGRPNEVARSSISLSGLTYEVAGQQFSAEVPKGSVLSQAPSAGQRIKRSEVVRVTISAGSETVIMPDVIGSALQEAKDRLQTLGLRVMTQDVVSSSTAGTVLESFPAPGVEVRTGETVRVSVATGGAAGDSLLPYDLAGLTIAIDPAPGSDGTPDVGLEVTRRLRSLLEASGATVSVTRSLTSGSVSDSERASILTSPTPDAAVGLALSPAGESGLTAIVVSSADSTFTAKAESIARVFTSSVRLPGKPVNTYRSGADALLGRVLAPSIRLLLGDATNAEDSSRFADPEWADSVARSLYRAIGETFAPR